MLCMCADHMKANGNSPAISSMYNSSLSVDTRGRKSGMIDMKIGSCYIQKGKGNILCTKYPLCSNYI
jgi:hypothetical protein